MSETAQFAQFDTGLGRWLPATMTSLVACACLVTTAPVLAAVLFAGYSLDRLSRQSDSVVRDGMNVVNLSVSLRDSIANLDRNSRQYLVVRDPQLLRLVNDRWREVTDLLSVLESSKADFDLAERLAALRVRLREAQALWSAGGEGDSQWREAVEALDRMEPDTADLIRASRDAIDAQVEQLRQSTLETNRMIFLCTLALIPLTAALSLGFSVAVTRPLQSLSRSISALGNARYDSPIAIAFPLEMSQLASRLDWLRTRLAQLEADKDRFLQHVSHELKTPLASLSEGADLLLEGNLGALSPPQMEVAQILRDSTGELDGSIGALLAYAEWRKERRLLQLGWFDAQSFAVDLLSAHRLVLSRRRLRVELNLSAARLFGQRAHLRVAVDNLLTNAIKHSGEGSTIVISSQASMLYQEISVRDHGNGVPDHEKEKIFEPFVRGAATVESGIRGTGVGLSIVREIAVAHGGRAFVEDAQPGARFRLTWPAPGRDA